MKTKWYCICLLQSICDKLVLSTTSFESAADEPFDTMSRSTLAATTHIICATTWGVSNVEFIVARKRITDNLRGKQHSMITKRHVLRGSLVVDRIVDGRVDHLLVSVSANLNRSPEL